MIRIFIDIDNIVADFETAFRKFLNKKLHRRLKRDDISEFSFWKSYSTVKPEEKRFYIEVIKKILSLLKLNFLLAHFEPKTLTEAEEKLFHKEFMEKNGYKKLKRIKNSRKGIKILNKFYDVKFVTARPIETRNITYRWFKQNKIFIKHDCLIFSKEKFSLSSQFDVIIEDRWKDSVKLAKNNKTVILFDYPWNRRKDENGNVLIHKKIIRVSNWKEVIKLIDDNVEEYKEPICDDKTIEIWKKSVEVQMHFNQLIMRNRITFTSIIFAAFGAALALQRLGQLEIPKIPLHISDVIIIVAGCGILSYFVIDTFYYFRLLLGAVDYTERMDRKYKKLGLTMSITSSIRHGVAEAILIIHYVIILLAFGSVIFIRLRVIEYIKSLL